MCIRTIGSWTVTSLLEGVSLAEERIGVTHVCVLAATTFRKYRTSKYLPVRSVSIQTTEIVTYRI
jgi:hypothetical protein